MNDLSTGMCSMTTQDAHIDHNTYHESVVSNLSDNEVVRHLTRRIRNNVQAYYPAIDGRTVKVTGKPWGGQGNARTFKFKIRSNIPLKNQHHVLFVKLYPIYGNFNPALFEYKTLQFLYERMPSIQKNLHVPRPLDFYPELNAYVMESAGSRNFKQYLLRNNSIFRNNGSLSELFSAVEGCATWLKAFHEITKSNKLATFSIKSYIDSLNQDYDYHSLRHFKFKQRTVQAIDTLIKNLGSLDNRYELPCAKWHWDFTPGHIYLDNNRITVIDILGGDDVPIYEDIGRFLAAMSTVNNFPLYPFFDHHRSETTLCDRFIESYASDTGYDKERFVLFTNIYKLKYLIIWFCGQHSRVSSKVHPIVGNAFANLRLVRLFERPLLRTVNEISQRLSKLS
jgi:hypothetical protein